MRVALIGGGMIGPVFAEAIGDLDNAELVAFSDIKEQVCHSLASRYGIGRVTTNWRDVMDMDDVDMVCIATPPFLHRDMVIAAADAGKHVLTEKPMAINLIEADEMIAACKRSGVTLGVIFMYRFMDTAKKIKWAVESGRLGKPIHASCYVKHLRTDDYYRMATWRGQWKGEGGGSLMSQAIHTIDLMLWIMGDVESLSGYYDTMTHSEIEVDDHAAATLRFENGAMGVIESSTAIWPGYVRRLEIHGSRGTIVLNDDDIEKWDVQDMDGDDYLSAVSKDSGDTASRPGFTSSEYHRLQIADFISAVKEDRSPQIDGCEGRRALEVIRALYQSHDKNSIVTFPITDDPGYGREPGER